MSTVQEPLTTLTLTLPGPSIRLPILQNGPPEGWSWDATGEVIIRAGAGPLSWAEPVGLAMLSAWAGRRHVRGWPVRVDDTLKSPYAWKCGLLARLAGKKPPPAEKLHFPISVFVDENSMATQIHDLMEGLDIPDDPTTTAVEHAIEDLCRNVFHHACTNGEGAHVAASYEPGSGRVRIGIADCGKGIAHDMRNNRGPDLTDTQAVQMALEPEVSGSAQPGINRGVGLYVVRRLALAAKGAFWIRTGSVLVTASTVSLEDSIPQVRAVPSEWKGTAVAVTFLTGKIQDFRGAMSAIRDDIEGRGPRFAEIQFFRRAEDQPGRPRIAIPPDVSNMALDRNRAYTLANEQIIPALRAGADVILDFSTIKVATQAFCHALVVPVCESFGPDVLKRLQFVACSSQVQAMIRTGIHYALREQFSKADA